MKINLRAYWVYGKPLIVLLIIFLAFKFLVYPFVNTPEFEKFLNEIGYWGYIILFIYLVISQVFAPVSGIPAVLLGIAIYGVAAGMMLVFLAGAVSSAINFWIARKYGRRIVKRFVGKDMMADIDLFSEIEGTKLVIMSRILGISFYDIISYALGLTNISFKKYYIISLIASAFTTIGFVLFLDNVQIETGMGLFVYLCVAMVFIIAFGLYIRNYLKKLRMIKSERDVKKADTLNKRQVT